MKLKFFSLLAVALLVFACSQEDAVELPQEQQTLTIETTQESTTPPERGNAATANRIGGGLFWCDPNYEFPQSDFGDPGFVIQVYWSDNPNDWPGGVIDIECARQEYFEYFCGLSMNWIQPQDPYQEAWRRDLGSTECWTIPGKSKDDVNTQSNNDDRVCTGPECD